MICFVSMPEGQRNSALMSHLPMFHPRSKFGPCKVPTEQNFLIILRWLPKFSCVLFCLHFYCPLTFCFLFTRVVPLLPVSLLLSHVCYVPLFPFLPPPGSLSFHSSLCRTKTSALLFSFSFSSPFVKVLIQVSVSGLHALTFQKVAIKGLPARPDDVLEKTDSGSRAFSSFLFLVLHCKREESWIEKGVERGEGFCGGRLNGGGSCVQKNTVMPTVGWDQQVEEQAMPM